MAENPTPYTDISGTITLGGTAQQVAPLDTSRKYLRISNPSAATESLWVNDKGVAAVAASPSLEIVPGQVYAPYPPPNNPISIIAATTGHAFEGAVGQ